MAGLGVFALIVAAIIAGFYVFFPDQARLIREDQLARMIYLLMLALFIGFGAFGLRGFRGQRVPLPRALFYLAIWAGLFAAGVLIVQVMQDLMSGGRVTT